MARAHSFLEDQSCCSQHLEVLRDRGPSHGQPVGELADGTGLVRDELEYPATSRISQGGQSVSDH
jgi:hypothetical protein